MGSKLFVGNLSFDTTSADLKAAFSRCGSCESAAVITDRATGRSRGFGFVEMSASDEAERAIAELNGTELQGRTLNVSAARERSSAPPRSFSDDGGGSLGGFTPPSAPFRKAGGSRRGLRAKKRSIF